MSFHTTDAEPRLFMASSSGLMVLDPSAHGRVSVFSIGHQALRVQAWRVAPSDWRAFADYMRRGVYRNDARVKVPGKRLLSKVVQVAGDPNQLGETRIDLTPALGGQTGNAIVVVEPTVQPKERWRRQRLVSWVEATNIGLDAFADGTRLVGWATSLRDGKPLQGVELTIEPGGVKGTTGDGGVARLPLSAAAGRVLVAKKGHDVALLPEYTSWWATEGSWKRQSPRDGLVWYVFDDRGMYKPKETVHLKGWVRRVAHGVKGDLVPMNGLASRVRYKVVDARGNDVGKGTAALDALGGFDLSFTLPDRMNLGTATVVLTSNAGKHVPGRITRHAFQVQEFRRPEYEVKTTPSAGPYLVGGHADVTLTASYYAGGALPGADVTWRATARPGTFVPPGRSDYVFGRFVPWWMGFGPPRPEAGQVRTETLSGKTDATGKHVLRLDFDGARPPQAMNVTVEGTVTDVNRQAWTSTSELLVHPAALYVGLKTAHPFVRRTEPIQVDAIVTDLDGKRVTGRPIDLKAERLAWKFDGDKWAEKVESTQRCHATSAAKDARCVFQTPEGGTYRVTADITDAKGRPNETQLTVWVTGGKTPPQRGVQQQRVTLIPDQKTYRVGDTAEVAVLAPFAPAEGLLTLRREGIVETRHFTMDKASTTLKVPIEAAWVPNVVLQVDLVGQAPRTDDKGVVNPKLPKRPAYASGTVNLSIPPRRRTLHLTVTPEKRKLEPGGTTWVDVGVKGPGGHPVAGGQVAVVVVDEAILSLTHYHLPDPLDAFYFQRGAGVQDSRLRSALVLANPKDVGGRCGRRGPRRRRVGQHPIPEGVRHGWAGQRHQRCARRRRRIPARPVPALGPCRADGDHSGLAGQRPRRAAAGHPAPQGLPRPGGVRAPGAHRCVGARPDQGQAPGQPHPLPGHGGGGVGDPLLRQG